LVDLLEHSTDLVEIASMESRHSRVHVSSSLV